MNQDIDYSKALADIKQGFQNVVPRVSQSGNKVTMVQGTEIFTFNITQPVTSTNILK
jgi:hypothetical protein